jgi:hypothetical protein
MGAKDHDVATSKITRMFATDPRIANPKPAEMHANAGTFLADAQSLGNPASAGQFVLVMHAIELALKSYLHERGYSLEDLKKVGHKLDKLFATAQAKGLSVGDPNAQSILSRLDKAGEQTAIRYDFCFEMPLIGDVLQTARLFLDATRPTLPSV